MTQFNLNLPTRNTYKHRIVSYFKKVYFQFYSVSLQKISEYVNELYMENRYYCPKVNNEFVFIPP